MMYGVILAGGSGTRFWPLSREEYPKQLLQIFGDQTLIQVTVSRIADLIPAKDLYIVTNPKQAEQIQFQLPSAAGLSPQFISEPFGKNTAAAIGLAAIYLRNKVQDGVMIVLSADHFIKDASAFLDTLRLANEVAEKGYLVTIGALPIRPETAYGYIEKGQALNEVPTASEVKRFVEKPDRQDAERYLQKETFFWNTGIFAWKISTILSEINKHMPELSEGLQSIEEKIGTEQEEDRLKEIYSTLLATSIDYGILEKSDRIAVIPSDMGWEDVGSWNALDEVIQKDEAGNIVTGNIVNIDCQNTTIYAGKRVVAVVGLKDIVVADTDDATLVCHKSSAQDVKKVVEILKKQNKESHRVHRTVIRAWGSYTVLEEGEGFKIKRIMVNPKSKLSLQRHRKRSEHWVVVSGTARVTCGESVYTIQANQSTFVPMGVKHRLENPTDEPLQLIEVQSGSYLGEDDIKRYQDDYGRVRKRKTKDKKT
ncbi:mannose-1-phosphate guanylyltransferase/mannose-6-phosphate isomerase [Nitrospira defluvii]|nr:mannose-1-phosphate guanylyltransferase/mannose-6-phosphate isomerase [Nitrospira defluvii]